MWIDYIQLSVNIVIGLTISQTTAQCLAPTCCKNDASACIFNITWPCDDWSSDHVYCKLYNLAMKRKPHTGTASKESQYLRIGYLIGQHNCNDNNCIIALIFAWYIRPICLRLHSWLIWLFINQQSKLYIIVKLFIYLFFIFVCIFLCPPFSKAHTIKRTHTHHTQSTNAFFFLFHPSVLIDNLLFLFALKTWLFCC